MGADKQIHNAYEDNSLAQISKYIWTELKGKCVPIFGYHFILYVIIYILWRSFYHRQYTNTQENTFCENYFSIGSTYTNKYKHNSYTHISKYIWPKFIGINKKILMNRTHNIDNTYTDNHIVIIIKRIVTSNSGYSLHSFNFNYHIHSCSSNSIAPFIVPTSFTPPITDFNGKKSVRSQH